ncbi:MAG: hypothetical protein SGJ17_15170 [Hyphomicrobiales bacterium]|nr:hypothetical protein [Hyphomicrobiales bacterium]
METADKFHHENSSVVAVTPYVLQQPRFRIEFFEVDTGLSRN